MTTTVAFKDVIDLPIWRPSAPAIAVASVGMGMAYDMTNDTTRSPRIYMLRSNAALDYYDTQNDEWMALASPGLAGTFGAGAACIFHPSQGPRGTVAAGCTTSAIVLSTALPAAVGKNQLANRGDSVGFRIRIIGNAAGGSGKTEERTIVGNTAGTTPTLYLDAPLSFTPGVGCAYQIRAGRVFMLGAGTVAAGIWKYYDIATNSYSGNLATANLPATISTDSVAVALSEDHTPNNKAPGGGFFGTITATASSSTTLTSATGPLPSGLQANEYRNFQVRIVEDTTTPTSVGQRRRIASHTAGVNAVWTVAAFAVTPSATAKFVIENDDDKILLRTSAVNTVFTYNIAANTWDTTTFTAGGSAAGAGVMMEQAHGLTYDNNGIGQARHSNIFIVRGGATATIDVLDIAGGANGAWETDIVYGNKGGVTFTTGSSAAYDAVTKGGRFFHICHNGTYRFLKFDMANRMMDVGCYLRYPPSTAVVGGKLAMSYHMDGATKLAFLYSLASSLALMFNRAIQ